MPGANLRIQEYVYRLHDPCPIGQRPTIEADLMRNPYFGRLEHFTVDLSPISIVKRSRGRVTTRNLAVQNPLTSFPPTPHVIPANTGVIRLWSNLIHLTFESPPPPMSFQRKLESLDTVAASLYVGRGLPHRFTRRSWFLEIPAFAGMT